MENGKVSTTDANVFCAQHPEINSSFENHFSGASRLNELLVPGWQNPTQII